MGGTHADDPVTVLKQLRELVFEEVADSMTSRNDN